MRHERINPLLLRGRREGAVVNLPAIAASPAGLWGTCRLNPAYAGPAVRLRRGSDNAERDWTPPDGSPWLPVPQIADWLGGASGYYAALYDQSGSGRHATQATAANQPAYALVSGRPVVQGNGTRGLAIGSALGIARNVGGFSAAAAAQATTITGGYKTFIQVRPNTGFDRASIYVNDSQWEAWGKHTDGASATNLTAGATTNFARLVTRWRYADAILDHQIDGGTPAVLNPFGAAGNTSDTDSAAAPTIFGASGGFVGNMTALALWSRALTDAERTAVNAALVQAVPA